MKRLALLGASGHGKVVADAALCSGWSEVIFFDDGWPSKNCNGSWPVKGNTALLLDSLMSYDGVVITIGNCKTRWEKYKILRAESARFATIIHPKAVVSRFASVQPGSVIMAGAVVNIDVVVGVSGIINTGATVDHDCQIGDVVHVCPGAHLAGGVEIGNCSWIGIGSTLKQGVVIGSNVMVGAGSVVVKNVADDLVVTGNPSREQNY